METHQDISLYMWHKQPTLRHTLDQMEKLRRSSKKARPDISRCNKHPKHQQSPGVCSLCLREKLEKVARKLSTYSGSSSLPRRTLSPTSSSTSSSLSSCYSSSSGSSSSSPAPEYEQKGSISWLFMSGENNVLSKSRSMVNYFPRRMRGKEGSEEKKNSRFWSKLLRPRRKRREESLVHSRTVREIRVPNRVY